jgi:cytochrome c-type biogenesis protein CcmH/NrfG
MIALVAITALMLAAALAFVLPTQQRRTAWALAVFIPTAAITVYAAVGNPGAREPIDALSEHIRRHPDDAGALTDLAVMLAMSTTQHLAGEPERLIERALAIDPKNAQALALSGSVRFERKDYAGAIALWRQVLAQVPAESPIAGSIAQSIEKAQALNTTSQ